VTAPARLWRGVALSLTVALAAGFLSDHYGAPVMLFALLIGLAFHFLSDDPRIEPGLAFAGRGLLQAGIVLLALRMPVRDLAAMGWLPLAGTAVLIVLTLAAGLALARLFGRSWRFGLLTGGAVAICGASAALAIAAVLPPDEDREADTAFTIVAVTALSSFAMVAYPILFHALGMGEARAGFLIGTTIHDVAQVAGAGYSVSPLAGDVAVLIKMERVALLPLVLIALAFFGRGRGSGGLHLPWFIAFFALGLAVNALGLVGARLAEISAFASRGLLVTAVAAIGLRTSLKAMFALGPRHFALVTAETAVLLAAAVLFAEVLLA
jgi:uncharacterized integral membrane protein (TIGR00698 family)